MQPNLSPNDLLETNQDSESAGRPDYWALLYRLYERIWIILVLAVLGALIGYVRSSMQAPVYAAKSTFSVDFTGPKVFNNIDDITQMDRGSAEQLATIIQTMGSPTLLTRVVRMHGLTNHPGFTAVPISEDRAAYLVGLAVKTSLRRGTRVIDVVAEHTNAPITQLLAKSVVDEFISSESDRLRKDSDSATQLLFEEREKLRKVVAEDERKMQQFRETNGIVVSAISDEQQTLLSEDLTALGAKLSAARLERLQLESDSKKLGEAGGSLEVLSTIPSVVRSPEVVAARERLDLLEREMATLALRYRKLHPRMVEQEQLIRVAKDRLKEALLAAPQLLRATYQQAVDVENNFARSYADQEKKVNDLAKRSLDVKMLSREAEANRTLLDSVTKRLKEINIISVDNNPRQMRFQVLEEPMVPKSPVRPNIKLSVLAAFWTGMVVALIVISILTALDGSIRTVDESERNLGLPVLAAIPQEKSLKMLPIVTDEQNSRVAEALRSLRAGIALLGRAEDKKCILFTSAAPGEGKSFCAANYAELLATEGKRVLLIDLDLRRPSLAKKFNIRDDQPGVSDYLLEDRPLGEFLIQPLKDNLFLLTAGKRVPNPAELLASPQVARLFAEATKQFDRVVMDTAPVNVVSDTLVVAQYCQLVCLVVRAAITPRRACQRAIQLLTRAGRPPSASVLNFLPNTGGVGYYYYYSSRKDYVYYTKAS